MPQHDLAPDSWIVEGVTLTHTSGDRSLQGVLRAVNDRGVVVEAEGDIYFYPWSGITRIHLGAVA